MSTDIDKKSAVSIVDAARYVTYRIGDLSLEERRAIFQIITNSSIETNKIQEKGGGVQIKFKDIPPAIILDIHNYMKRKIDEKLERLNSLTEENNDSQIDD
jgi:hypothetical protein